MFNMDPRVLTALLLTCLGAAGTALGGLIVVVQPKMSFKRLGVLQGLAAGLMLSISVFDLLPGAVEEIGYLAGHAWFYAGVAFFAIVVAVIPEPSSANFVIVDDEEDNVAGAGAAASAAATPGKAPRKDAKRVAGAASDPADIVSATIGADAAAVGRAGRREAKRRVLVSGLITALGIALHNFPEGVAVFLASFKSTAVGASLAFAIALHNVPEGVAVALPVYFATGSRWTGFKYAFISGLAEPAAVVVLGVLFPTDLSKHLVEVLLAAVGGIMAFLAVSELLPLALEHAGRPAAVGALFAGMALMSANMWLLDHWVGGGEGGHSH